MAKPTCRIPKSLLPTLEHAAATRGVQQSVLVGQALRFYLTATDPALVAHTVAEALKPLAADLRHIRYRIDAQQDGAEPYEPVVPSPTGTPDPIQRLLAAKQPCIAGPTKQAPRDPPTNPQQRPQESESPASPTTRYPWRQEPARAGSQGSTLRPDEPFAR